MSVQLDGRKIGQMHTTRQVRGERVITTQALDVELDRAGTKMKLSTREIDTETVVRSRLYVDRRESALKEPGDIIIPLEDGDITPDHIVGEIGEILVGKVPARREADEITLFKSLGLAIEDLGAANHVLAEARRLGVGTEVSLGGARHAAH